MRKKKREKELTYKEIWRGELAAHGTIFFNIWVEATDITWGCK